MRWVRFLLVVIRIWFDIFFLDFGKDCFNVKKVFLMERFCVSKVLLLWVNLYFV